MMRCVERGSRAAHALVGIAVALWPATARAQGVGLIVHAPAGAPATPDQVRAALARAAARAGERAETRPFARAAALLAAGSVQAERLDGFARVERLAGEGWRGYLEARFAEAAARLGEASSQAVALLDLAGGLELYADLSLRRGAVELALGRDREAELAFRLAAALDPARAVTDAEFKPAVVERYRLARSGERPRHRRRIEVEPAGATVEVDGGATVAAPLELELEEGTHVLVARAPGRMPRAMVVSGEGSAVRLSLAEDRLAAAARAAGLSIGRGEREAGEVGAALIAAGELDGILIAASVWRGGRPALLGQLCRGAPLGCGRAVEIGHGGSLDRAAAELWREVGRPGRHPLTLLADARLVHRELAPRDGAKRDRRWWQSRWIWVGVGGLALSAVAAGVVLGAGEGDLEWTVSSDGCEFGGC